MAHNVDITLTQQPEGMKQGKMEKQTWTHKYLTLQADRSKDTYCTVTLYHSVLKTVEYRDMMFDAVKNITCLLSFYVCFTSIKASIWSINTYFVLLLQLIIKLQKIFDIFRFFFIPHSHRKISARPILLLQHGCILLYVQMIHCL